MKKNLLTIAAAAVAFSPVLLVASEGGSDLARFGLLAYGVALAYIAKRTGLASRLGDAIDAVFPDTAISE